MLDKTTSISLEPKYLSAKELGIPKKWYDALLLVKKAMECGEFHHVSNEEMFELLVDGRDASPEAHEFRGAFNMGVWGEDGMSCGSVKCIGGSAESLGNVVFDLHAENGRIKERYKEIHDLFYPPDKCDWDTITVDQAHLALVSYLTFGKANWKCILETVHG